MGRHALRDELTTAMAINETDVVRDDHEEMRTDAMHSVANECTLRQENALLHWRRG
jgi:hypothetical protein